MRFAPTEQIVARALTRLGRSELSAPYLARAASPIPPKAPPIPIRTKAVNPRDRLSRLKRACTSAYPSRARGASGLLLRLPDRCTFSEGTLLPGVVDRDNHRRPINRHQEIGIPAIMTIIPRTVNLTRGNVLPRHVILQCSSPSHRSSARASSPRPTTIRWPKRYCTVACGQSLGRRRPRPNDMRRITAAAESRGRLEAGLRGHGRSAGTEAALTAKPSTSTAITGDAPASISPATQPGKCRCSSVSSWTPATPTGCAD